MFQHLYHLTDARNWPSIERAGLLSTRRLLERTNISEAERRLIGREHRPASLPLPDGVIINDQKPMPPNRLARALIGLTVSDWYALLNSKVFFWPNESRLMAHQRAYSHIKHVVLTFDASRLIARYASTITLSAINTGSTQHKPALRGNATFVPFDTWRRSGWLAEYQGLPRTPRNRPCAPAELTVADAVPDAMTYLIDVRTHEPRAG